MNRNLLTLLAVLPCSLGMLQAQNQTVSTRVFTDPLGVRFFIDGQVYVTPQNFLWPAGSKHTISVEHNQLHYTNLTRFTFTGWVDNTSLFNSSSDSVVVTADPAVTFIKATFTTEIKLSVQFYDC